MSDTIPTPVDLLRAWMQHPDADSDEAQSLLVWLDEHLPPADLGPVTPHTPWGSLCRHSERELLFIGRSATAPTEWVAQEPTSWYTYTCPFGDRWRVVRSGPAEPEPETERGPKGTNVGDPITPDTPIGTWVKIGVHGRMVQVGKHGTGDDSLRWWDTEGHQRGYGNPRYTVADPAEVEQWQAQR